MRLGGGHAAPQGALRAASFSASLVMTTKKYARPAAARNSLVSRPR